MLNLYHFTLKHDSKDVDFTYKQAKCSFQAVQAQKRRFQAQIGLNVVFTVKCDHKDVDFT